MLHPSYAILGNGRWAHRMHDVLAAQSQVTMLGETRRRGEENEVEYTARIAANLARTGAQAVWICVPPSPNTPLMVSAALERGLHVIVEKPWLWPGEELARKARSAGLVVGIHHEYCLLDAVEAWREQAGEGLVFGGRFTTSGANSLDIPAIENLGSHLFAIRVYACPEAETGEIDCAYDDADKRVVWLSRQEGRFAEIDFTASREPIIQRYISRFESAMDKGEFPFGLEFGARVLQGLRGYKGRPLQKD